MNTDQLQSWMLEALKQAQLRRGFCAPNPSVGAVIVKNDQIIAHGHHPGPGHPHAEVNAIAMAGVAAQGAALLVTLEPCCHTGRTPPCTDAIIAAGITEVWFGFYDPNDVVAGKGQKTLQDAGISCQFLAVTEVIEFYRSYYHWTIHHRPYVTVKLALTANGGVAKRCGSPIRITGLEANQFTHRARYCADAILTSIATVLADDPQLNARQVHSITAKPVMLIDPQARLPLDATLWQTAKSITIFHTADAPLERINALVSQGAHCIESASLPTGRLDLDGLLASIASIGIHDLWVEVGPTLFKALLAINAVSETKVLISSKMHQSEMPANLDAVIGNGQQGSSDWLQLGDDCLWTHRYE